MTCFGQGCTSEMACRNKDSLCGSAQSSPEIVHFRTADRMSPSLDLRLHVRPRKKVVVLRDVCIRIDSAISRRASDGDVYETASFKNNLDEVFKLVRRKLE